MSEKNPRGISTEAVGKYLTDNLPDLEPPLEYELIAAGGSNLTFRLRDNTGKSFALRRPPEGKALATAHDMGREWKIMSSLKNSAVPVPECLLFCQDAEITGAPFYVMSFMDGLILRDTESAKSMTAEQAMAATESLVNVQTQMHKIDLQKTELADLGKHEDYVGRQLKRWNRQVSEGGVRDLPLHKELHERLLKSKPDESAPPGLAHGDYRFDNCVLDQSSHEVMAVLDWELCTIGDPIADFVWSLQYWGEAGDELTFLPDPPTMADIFVSRQEYISLYEKSTGFDLSDIDYYTVFSWWKQASIVEGVYARRLAGATGGMQTGDAGSIAERVDVMLGYAADLAQNVI